jgi:glycosyltransferase involved in cell wall biosynthesis
MFVNNTITNDPRVKGEAKALSESGHEVTIVGRWNGNLLMEELWEGVRFLRDKHVPTSTARKLLLLLKLIITFLFNKYSLKENCMIIMEKNLRRKWAEQVEIESYDVYHAHDLDTLGRAFIYAEKNNSKLVYDSHELWVEWHRKRGTSPFICNMWEETEKRISPKADLVITVSDKIAQEIQINNNLAEMPLVLYNCADLKPYQKLNILREKYIKTSNDRRIILYQGHVKENRGLCQFVDIAYALPEMDFVIIGPSAASPFYEKLLDDSKKADNIFILPPVSYDDLWSITCSADFGYVCTEPFCLSYQFSLSNKIFEYMTAGLPVFASDLDGHRELSAKLPVEKNPIFFIPHNNPQKAAEILKTVVYSIDIGRKSADAYYIAENFYNRRFEFQKLVEAYSKL